MEMIKKLAKSVREYKKLAIITPILVSIEVILEVVIPMFMAKLIDEGIYAGEMPVIYKIGLELVILSVLALIAGCISSATASKASAGFAKNLRKDMYYKVQDFSFANIDKFSTASIVTRLTTDVSNIQMAFQMVTRIVVRAPLLLIFSLIMAFTINAKLSLIFLGLIPIVSLALALITSKAHPIFVKIFAKYDILNRVVEENIRGIRVVKSYVLEEKEKNKFNDISNEIYTNFTKAEKLIALNAPVMQIAAYSAILLLSWFGAKMIVGSGMTTFTTGELTSLITYAIQILTTLMMITMLIVMSTMAKTSADRIYEILDEKPDLKNPINAKREIKDGSIEFKNVYFSYVKDKNKMSLKNININIKSGETIGIIGGTGVGKSSFVNLIPRLYDVTEGSVKVGGIDVKEYDIETLRNKVAMVLQKNVLFSGTIIDNLKWRKQNVTEEEIKRVCKLAQADEFIENFPDKYNTYIEQGGSNVSGGQKQRLCIARALLKNPKILILDDSTSAVDTKTDKLIRKAFKEEIPNTTKIIIAQRISSVEDADKIIVFDNGEVNGFGTHEELLKTNEIYKEVYESQVKGGENNND